MSFFGTILDWLFPNRCLSCGKEGSLLCGKCLADVPPADRTEHDFIFPVYSYRNALMKRAIWTLKYRRKKEIAEILAEAVYEKIVEELHDLEIFENFRDPILVAIPLSREKLRERGFNQSEVLAREISRLSGGRIPYCGILIKNKETEPQARIKDRLKRLQNLKGCFGVKGDSAKGRNVIIIDDVSTTGATICEAKKTLIKEGAAYRAVAFTVAH